MKRLSLVLAAALCLLVIASAGPGVTAKESWTSVRSKNFLLVGNASEKEIKQVAVRLEQFREVASRLFVRANFNSPVPTTVVVFKSDSSYRPFKPNANTAGYFQAGPDVNYITLKTEVNDDLNPFGVIFHEYTHLLVNNTNGNVPTWFNEGLAEYYSTFSITDDRKVVLGKPIANHVYLLRENKMLPLRTLFKVDQQSAYYNERDKQSIFYAESWALMHYLIGDKKGQRLEQLGKFIQLLETNLPMEQAFQQAFQTTFENMEKALREYIKRDSYPVTAGHFENKLNLDTEMQAVPLTEAEAQAYLGDLLLHSHRAEAEGYLQKALALDPKLAMANAALGMLRLRQGKIVEARESLERAIAVNSKDYLIHYNYAFALSREGMNNMQLVTGYQPETADKIRAELKKAIELRPDYPESYNLLAFVNLVTETQLDESITLLKRALSISPGRNDLLFTLSQVYMRKEDYKTARQILERLSQNNGDQRLRQQAQGLLKQLDIMEEQFARLEAMRNAPEKTNGSEPPRFVVGGTRTEADAPPPDPASCLRDALRTPGAGEKRVQGSLLRIDCDNKGITFVVKIDDRIVKLHTDTFQNVQMVSFSADAGMEVTCGPRKPENAVVICYVPSSEPKARFDGTIKSMEFVPKDFKLKA
jgi:tetratricopeptide (TPR) repeat protein